MAPTKKKNSRTEEKTLYQNRERKQMQHTLNKNQNKNGLILPTGQCHAPSAVINYAWYCMVLHGVARYCIVLHGIAWCCMVLHWIALHGIAW